MYSPETLSHAAIRAAQERIADLAIRTPLIRLHIKDAPAEIYLKLENLQPLGAFKLRRAGRGKVVCVVSGGNIAPPKLAKILDGEVP